MDDIVKIFDNYSGNRKFSFKVTLDQKRALSDKIVILLCFEGWAKINVGFRDYTMKKNSFLAIAPGIPFFCREISDDFKVDILVIREEVFNRLSYGVIRLYFYRIMYIDPLLEMPEEKMRMCMNIHYYLKDFINENDNYFKPQLIAKFMDILFYEACNAILHKSAKNGRKDRHRDEIMARYIKLVDENFRRHRKLEFYADKMNITAKYLSAVIKSATGRTATQWLDDYTLLEAKTLLRSSTATIQEISYELGFSTPSHFAKFFRDRTGVSPKDARNSDPGSF